MSWMSDIDIPATSSRGYTSDRTKIPDSIAIVGCVHGNETIGKDVIDTLSYLKFKDIDLELIIANQKALEKKTRFVETDLNRCFPGSKEGCYEERIAAELVRKLNRYEYVIDIHSTTSRSDNFVIITKDDPQLMELVSYLPLDKVVKMEPNIAKGNAINDHVENCISIEFDETTDRRFAVGTIVGCISNILGNKHYSGKEFYSVYEVMKKNGMEPLENFKETTIDEETFYPVLSGEAAYKDLLCLKARKIK